MISLQLSGRGRLWALGWIVICALSVLPVAAQGPAIRIQNEINSSDTVPLKASRPWADEAALDAGRMSPDSKLHGVSIIFNRSASGCFSHVNT